LWAPAFRKNSKEQKH